VARPSWLSGLEGTNPGRRSARRTAPAVLAPAVLVSLLPLWSAPAVAEAESSSTSAAALEPEFLEPGGRPKSGTVQAPVPNVAAVPAGGSRPMGGPNFAEGDPAPPLSAADQARQRARQKAQSSGARVRVEETITDSSVEYANPDGTFTAELSAGPARVRQDGEWVPVDTSLEPRGGRWAARAATAQVELSPGGDRTLSRVSRDDWTVGVDWTGSALPAPTIKDGVATYRKVRPGVDLVTRVNRYGTEHSFVLHERPSSAPVFTLPLKLSPGVTAEQDGHGVLLRAPSGEQVGHVGGTFSFGAERDPRSDEPVHASSTRTRLEQTPSGPVVHVEPDPAFLADPAVTYPVTVDPDVALGDTFDTYIDRSYPNTGYSTSWELHVGYYTSGGTSGLKRSFASFDTAAIAGKKVTDAKLRLWAHHSWSCNPTPMAVKGAAHSSSSSTWNNPPNIYTQYDTAYSFAIGYDSNCADGTVHVPVTKLLQYWAGANAQTAALALVAGNEGDVYGYKKFHSGNAGSWVPVILVTYDGAPGRPYGRSVTPNTCGSSCVNPVPTTSLTPKLTGNASDPEGDTLRYDFEVFAGHLTTTNSSGEPLPGTATRVAYGSASGASGTTVGWNVPAAKLVDGGEYSYRVRAWDGQQYGLWSEGWAQFTVDLTATVAPTVSISRTPTAGPGGIDPDGAGPLSAPFGHGDTAGFLVTVTNPGTITDDAVGLSVNLGDTVLGAVREGTGLSSPACPTTVCSVSGQVLTIAAKALSAGASRSYFLTGTMTGTERDCIDRVLTATASGEAGIGSNTLSTTVCASGLGREAWWSQAAATTVGAQVQLAVNPANGNVVVSAEDSTAVPARGRLAYVLRRTYNSQETSVATLPGSLGAGWSLNVGFSGDLAGAGVTPTGLHVPRLGETVASLTDPLAVTLVDRDGTRHLFRPKGLAVNTTGLAETDPRRLQRLTLPPPKADGTTYKSICLAGTYTPPPGVELGLFRYVAVTTDGTSACTATTIAAGVMVGYVAVRPDRLRTEFAATGQLLSMLDGSGVELRYAYDGTTLTNGQLVGGVVTGPLRLVYEPRSTDGAGGACPEGRSGTTPTLPAGCRAFRFDYTTSTGGGTTTVTDPAGRATRYELSATTIAGVPTETQLLTRVVNPPETAGGAADHVEYRYSGDGSTPCGGSTAQLCAITDARQHTSSLSYSIPASGDPVSKLAGVGRAASVTDRLGTATTISYPSRTATSTLRDGQQQQAFLAIDEFGRAGQVKHGSPGDATVDSYPALRATTFTWDGDSSASCARPQANRDNNLCGQVRHGSTNASSSGISTPDGTTGWLYNDLGQVLREERQVPNDPNSSYKSGVEQTSLITTHSYAKQYWTGSGTVLSKTDSLSGAGLVSGSAPSSTESTSVLFAVSDRTSSLPARGNASTLPTGETYARYLTEYTVDRSSSAPPNVQHGDGVCGGTTANTGLLCSSSVTTGPVTASVSATTRYSYDSFGQRRTMRTPNAGATGAPYTYVYASGNRKDLSGGVSAVGWLIGVADPTGKIAVFGHDRAGNVARTWDRNATAGVSGADTDSKVNSFLDAQSTTQRSTRYAETLYNTGTDQQALAAPWRYLVSERTPTGDRTNTCRDEHGSPLLVRPPRGSSGTTIGDCAAALTSPGSYDTLYNTSTGREATPDDQPTSVLLPADAARNGASTDRPTTFGYDDFGNQTSVTDPRGVPTSTSFDVVNRPQAVRTIRGTETDTGPKPAACSTGTTGAENGKVVCTTSTAYDSHDNPVTVTDRDGQTTRTSYNAVGWPVRITTPGHSSDRLRNGASATGPNELLRTERRYDADGNVLTTCAPRQLPAETSSCTASSQYARHASYDPAGRQLTDASYRDAGTRLETTFGYDATGNRTSVKDANDHTTTAAFDVLDRQTGLTRPRSTDPSTTPPTTLSFTTSFGYDAVGNRTSVTQQLDTAGAPRVDAYSYDANNRLVDTVIGASSTDAAQAGTGSGTANVRTRQMYDADGHLVGQYGPRAFTASTSDPDERFLTRVDVDRNGRPAATYTPRYDTADSATNDAAGSASGEFGWGTQRAECPTTARPTVTVASVPDYPPSVGVCVTRTSYDAAGRATTVTLPTAGGAQPGSTSRQLTYGYSDDGLQVRQDAPSPTGTGTVTTRTDYDGTGRPVRVIAPPAPDIAGGTEQPRTATTSWTADGLLATTVEQGYTRDTTTVTHETVFGYDADGNRLSTRDAAGHTAWQSWTSDGLLASSTVGGSSTADTGLKTTYGHDRVGNVLTVLDPSGNAGDATNPTKVATAHTYTHDNLLDTTTLPPGAGGQRLRTSYGYDGAGRKISQNTAKVVDDNNDTAPAVVVSDAGTMTFAHSPANRLASQTGRAGTSTISTDYDAAGNPTRTRDSTANVDDSTGGPGSTLTATFYLDNLVRTVDDTGSSGAGGMQTAYGYNGSGQPTVRLHGPTTDTTNTRFEYNDAGVLTKTASSATLPAGADKIWQTSYDPAARPISETAPNGQLTRFEYNPDDTLRTKTTWTDSTTSSVVAKWDYTYDNLKRQLTAQHSGTAAGGSTLPADDHQYEYDPAGRVKTFRDGANASVTHTATYDDNSNRLSYSTPGKGVQYSTYHADNTVNTSTDETGGDSRTHSYWPFGGLQTDGCYRYDYDAFDRLRRTGPQAGSTTCATAPVTIYAYDGQDRQRERLEDPAGLTASTRTGLHHDGLGTAVARQDSREASTGLSLATGRAVTLDAAGTAVADSSRTATGSSTNTDYLLTDGHGTVTTITDDTPTDGGGSTSTFTNCTARFDPWGRNKTTSAGNQTPGKTGSDPATSPCNTGSTSNDNFYRGERRDTATGTYQLGSRTYDPARTAFLTPDGHRDQHSNADLSVGTDPLTLNRYNYVNGDPLNYLDPSGHEPRPWHGGQRCDTKCARTYLAGEAVAYAAMKARVAAASGQPSPTPGLPPGASATGYAGPRLVVVPPSEVCAAPSRGVAAQCGERPGMLYGVGEPSDLVRFSEKLGIFLTEDYVQCGQGVATASGGADTVVSCAFSIPWGKLAKLGKLPGGGSGRGVWDLDPFERGREIEKQLGHNLHPDFPTIDVFDNGVATSIKSLDLAAPSYADASKLEAAVRAHVRKVSNFNGATYGGYTVDGAAITKRELVLAVNPDDFQPSQAGTFANLGVYAARRGVDFILVPYK